MVVRKLLIFTKAVMPVMIGLTIGIALSLVCLPVIDENCSMLSGETDHLGRKTNSLNEKQSLDYSNSDDFEPRIKTFVKSKSGTKINPKTFRRPRYASTELGIREKLFVGVLSSKNTINTLATAVNITLSQYISKLVFFMDRRGQKIPSGMSIVSFTDGRTQLKPFHMMKYIHDHYGQAYDYYVFVTDDTYVRGEQLFELVSSIGVGHVTHMGRPLQQKGSIHEFCAMNSGIVISQDVLGKVIEHLEWCGKNAMSSNSPDSLGRCIAHALGKSCVTETADQTFKHFAVNDLNFDTDIEKLQHDPNFRSTLTVSNIPDETTMFKLHRFFCELDVNHTKEEIAKLQQEILDLSPFTPEGREGLTWPIGVQPPYKPKTRFDVIKWDYFTEKHIYFSNDYSNMEELKGIQKLDIQEVIKTSVKKLNERYNNVFTFSRLINGYRRFDPTRGMEYTLDLSLKEKDKVVETQKRVHLLRPLSLVEIVPMPYVTENSRVNLVLPITTADRDGVVSFLDSYAKTCLDSGDNVNLFLVFVTDPISKEDDAFSVLKSMITYYENKYQNRAHIAWIGIKSSNPTQFTIMDAVSKKFPGDAILLLCSVGMELSIDFLNRVRMNTIVGWQVFFPIGFYQYKPNLIYNEKPYPTEIEIDKNTGHFDRFSFEHASFYNNDYKEARANVNVDLSKDDIFSMFVKQKRLHVFRAIEPALKHKYRERVCNPISDEEVYQRCLMSRAEGLASRSQLAMLIFEHQKKLDPTHMDVLHQQKDQNVNQMKPNMLKK